MQSTRSQGPSGKNQTSLDHSLDSNQAARQPDVREELKAEGLDFQSTKNVDLGENGAEKLETEDSDSSE